MSRITAESIFDLFRPGLPQIVTDDDTARTRRSDPPASHKARDRSQTTRKQFRTAVLELVRIHGMATGSELNEYYELLAPRMEGWPKPTKKNWDSPRKRAGELAKDGLLVRAEPENGTEGIYSLTDAGRKAVSRG